MELGFWGNVRRFLKRVDAAAAACSTAISRSFFHNANASKEELTIREFEWRIGVSPRFTLTISFITNKGLGSGPFKFTTLQLDRSPLIILSLVKLHPRYILIIIIFFV